MNRRALIFLGVGSLTLAIAAGGCVTATSGQPTPKAQLEGPAPQLTALRTTNVPIPNSSPTLAMALALVSNTPTPIATGTPIPPPPSTPTPTLAAPTAPASPAGQPKTQQTMRQLAAELGLSVGCEFTGWWFDDPRWRKIVGTEFDTAVVDWGIHWPEVEPKKGAFDFRIVDRQLALAEQYGMVVRGQPLVFAALNPDWLSNLSGVDLKDELVAHIDTVVKHYRGRVGQWVVVNEPYAFPYRQKDIFYEKLGPQYIDLAFQTARSADPTAILIYNDDLNNSPKGVKPYGVMTHLTREIVGRLKAKGLIDGVGLQMHLDGANPPSKEDVVKTMRGYGIPVYVTEFDVNMKDVPGSHAERLAKQAAIYRGMLEAALESGVVKSFTFWGIGDKNSWLERMNIPGRSSPNAEPTLFDDDLQPKPAYFAIKSLLQERLGASQVR